MKKLAAFAMAIALIFGLAACGTAQTNEPDTQSSEPVSSSEPDEAVYEPGSPESIIPTVITDPELTYQEDTDSLTGNNGAEIGTEETARQSVEDGVEFSASGYGFQSLPFTKRLDSEGMESCANQAVYVSFCPSEKSFGFTLASDKSFAVTTSEDGEPNVLMIGDNYTVPIDTDLRIEPGNWYGIFMAMSSDGNFQGALWKDNDPDNAAYFSSALGALEDGDMYKNSSWQLSVGLSGESTIKIARYCYYTFSGFVNETAVPDTSGREAYLNADPMNVVQTVLNDPHLLAGEDASIMTEDMGGLFGSIDIKQPGEDGAYFQFAAENNSAWMPYNDRLADAGGEHRGNTQALLIKFQPEQAENLSFHFFGIGDLELAVAFDEQNHPNFVNIQEAMKFPFSDYAPTDLELESGKWYYGLFAFDTHGNFRAVIWEDGNAEGRGVCTENLGEQRDDYRDSNWEFVIGFDAGGTLNVESYDIMDFDGFADANS